MFLVNMSVADVGICFCTSDSPKQRETFLHFAEFGDERTNFKVDERRHRSAGVEQP